MDTIITLWLNGFLYMNDMFDGFVYVVAQYSVYLISAIFIYVFIKQYGTRSKYVFIGISTAICAWLISQGINILTAVERPFIELHNITPLFTHGLNDSFPSGHLTIVFVLAFYTYHHNKVAGLILIILSIISGIARVIAGIHWPTDILGSIVLAYATIFLVKYFYEKFKK